MYMYLNIQWYERSNVKVFDSSAAITFLTSLFRKGFNPSFLNIMSTRRTGVDKILLTLVIQALGFPE